MMFGRLLVVAVLSVLVRSDDGAQKTYTIYETAEKIIADGFPSETHHVTTSDGYILEMHRIPHGRSAADTTEDKPVVFIMHGFLSASNGFIGFGPEYSLAYNLADAGIDVWMGNARGNKNSRYHITLDPDDELEKFQFFDFSFEEIGIYDLPAMIDYILEYTGKDKLHYIGHSQGGTVFLILTSMLPEYNEKILSAHTLAGVGYQEYFPDTQLQQTAVFTDIIYGIALQMGIVELYPPNSTEMIPGLITEGLFPYRTSDYCAGDIRMRHTCQLLDLQRILGDDLIFDEDTIPGGAALKQMAHFGQNIRDKLFRRYHHGIFENLSIYGTLQPPVYDLSLITTQVTMHYSLNDTLLDERDVLAMVADMPNAIARQVARASFSHVDYLDAYDAKELVTDFIIEAIRNERQENYYTVNDEVIEVDGPPNNSSNTDVTNANDDNATTPATPATTPATLAITPAADSATTPSAMLSMFLLVISVFVILK